MSVPRVRIPPGGSTRHRLFADMLSAALEAVEPRSCVERALRRVLLPGGEVSVLAVGKAAPAMTRGAAAVLGNRFGRAVVVSDHAEPVPGRTDLIVSSHPVPDHTSAEAGRRLLAEAARATGHVLFLISGGGSSLAEVPAPGLDIVDVAETNAVLVRSGAPIEEINTVRAHISALKGGRLAATAGSPATTVLLSDVGDRHHLVASGPTVPCSTTPADALAVLERHGLFESIPRPVVEALRGAAPPVPAVNGTVIVAGDGATAASAAIAAAERAGVAASLLTTDLSGPAADAARWALEEAPPGTVSVLAGETTVVVTGSGSGGRNQEAALAAALAISGTSRVFAAFGTDGVDGPTDAAGAIVDGSTVERILAAGIDPVASLADNDSHPALDAAGALIRCGPTGTNVADLWLVGDR